MSGRRWVGAAALTGFVGCVWLANYFITHVGDQPFPGGPHTIPVGFGQDAPSGVLWIGVALVLRDAVQRHLGKRAAVVGVLVGAALSYFIAPSFAFASGAAFLVSELLDFAVYTPLVKRGRVVAAVAASNTVGLFVDTFLFLWIAFDSLNFWQGQAIGKSYATLAAIPFLLWMRRGKMDAGRGRSSTDRAPGRTRGIAIPASRKAPEGTGSSPVGSSQVREPLR